MAKGIKTGGRTKGVPNRKTAEMQALLASLVGTNSAAHAMMIAATALEELAADFRAKAAKVAMADHHLKQ